MSIDNLSVKPSYSVRIIIGVLCLLAFSITIPPLGFMGFLYHVGLLGDSLEFSDGVLEYQDQITVGLIALFAFFSGVVIYIKNRTLFQVGMYILIFLAVASLGGCVMMLSGLRNNLGG